MNRGHSFNLSHIVKAHGHSGLPGKSSARRSVAMVVMDYITRGLSPEEMVLHYPYLKLAEVHASMAFYHDHRAEIDAEIESERNELEQMGDNAQSAVWQN